jgi:hypothetical protein
MYYVLENQRLNQTLIPHNVIDDFNKFKFPKTDFALSEIIDELD